jgi:hypothetical protein
METNGGTSGKFSGLAFNAPAPYSKMLFQLCQATRDKQFANNCKSEVELLMAKASIVMYATLLSMITGSIMALFVVFYFWILPNMSFHKVEL